MVYHGACLQPEQPSLRIPLPGWASSWQNEEGLQCSSVSLPHNITAATRRAASDPPTRVKMSHWEHTHGRRGDGLALPLVEASRVPSMSHCCLTHWISAPSRGCHMEGKVSQASGKAVRAHSSYSLQYHLGCNSQIGPAKLRSSMWCDTFPDSNPSGNAQSCKIVSWGMSSHQWCFTAFRAALRHDHQPSRTFQGQSPALVRQNLGYHA